MYPFPALTRTQAKPSGSPIGINWAQAPRNLVACYPFSDNSFAELVTGTVPTGKSGASLGFTPYGSGVQFTSTGYLGYALNPASASWHNATSPFSLELVMWPTAVLGAGSIVNMGQVTAPVPGGPDSFMQVVGNSNNVVTYWNFYSAITTSSIAPAANAYLHIVITGENGLQTLYVNNIGQGGATQATPFDEAATAMLFGMTNSTGNPPFVGTMLMANVSSAMWSTAEIAGRFYNPWGFLQYEQDVFNSSMLSTPAGNVIFDSAGYDAFAGNIDFGADSFKAMLVDNTYNPSKVTHQKRSDVTGEISGTGYSAGGNAITVSVSNVTSLNQAQLGFGSVSWTSSSITAYGMVIYKSRGGAASADNLVAYVTLSPVPTTSGGTLAVSSFNLGMQM
jgi:hypothetical protein